MDNVEKEKRMLTKGDNGDSEIVVKQNVSIKHTNILNTVNLKDNQFSSTTTFLDVSLPTLKMKETAEVPYATENKFQTTKSNLVNDIIEIDDSKEGVITVEDSCSQTQIIQNPDNLENNKLLSTTSISFDSIQFSKLKETQSELSYELELTKNKMSNDIIEIDDEKEDGMVTDEDDDDVIEIIDIKNVCNETPINPNSKSLKNNILLNNTIIINDSTASPKSNLELEVSEENIKNKFSNNDKEIDAKKDEGVLTNEDDDDIIEMIDIKNASNESPINQNSKNLKNNKLLNNAMIINDSSAVPKSNLELEVSKETIKNICSIDNEKEEGMITDEDDDDIIETPINQNSEDLKNNKLLNNAMIINDSSAALKSKLELEVSKEAIKNMCTNDNKEFDDEKEEGMITDEDDDDIVEMIGIKNASNEKPISQNSETLKNNKLLNNARMFNDSSASLKSDLKFELSKETIKNICSNNNKELDDEKEEGMISDDSDNEVEMVMQEKQRNESINVSNFISKGNDNFIKFKETATKYGIKRSSTKITDENQDDIGSAIKRKKSEQMDYGTQISITFDRKKRIISANYANEKSLENKKIPTTIYVDDGEMPSTSKRTECSSPDYTGLENLFFIDTTPRLITNESVPSFNSITKNKIVEDKNICRQRNNVCFNCGSTEHPLAECTEPKNKKNIIRAKRQFKSNNERYHKKCGRFDHIKPGQMDDEVAKVLGLRKGQIPPYRYQMRKYGYPPAWLKAAQIQSSGLCVIICSNEPKKNVESERRYRRSAIIDFPGFNSIPFKGFYDDYKFHNVPPLTPSLMKDAFLKTLDPYLVEADYASADDIGNSTIESNNDISINSIDMVLEDDDEECTNVEFCGPLLPNKNKDNDDVILSSLDEELESSVEENIKEIDSSPSTPKTKAISSTTLDSYVSTPLLNFSGFEKLPPLSNFQKDVSCELLLFENLPDACGSYNKIKTLLDKYKKDRNESKDQSEND